ncbi:hypothetical protein TSOC_005437 [Tetrabaena socialis]|uniref:Uncharacterized protein n=1 Tax=Tetrabaena socialis TaxID=47790 RepID=A0A2J8A689_9CHLO|nr:hypothetical protein TSOC_005437 [Tetrabaena socialis]|eukprot:PNH08041.1 hypothetical protein TSOC_005437 [Tetrabaena socialis]
MSAPGPTASPTKVAFSDTKDEYRYRQRRYSDSGSSSGSHGSDSEDSASDDRRSRPRSASRSASRSSRRDRDVPDARRKGSLKEPAFPQPAPPSPLPGTAGVLYPPGSGYPRPPSPSPATTPTKAYTSPRSTVGASPALLMTQYGAQQVQGAQYGPPYGVQQNGPQSGAQQYGAQHGFSYGGQQGMPPNVAPASSPASHAYPNPYPPAHAHQHQQQHHQHQQHQQQQPYSYLMEPLQALSLHSTPAGLTAAPTSFTAAAAAAEGEAQAAAARGFQSQTATGVIPPSFAGPWPHAHHGSSSQQRQAPLALPALAPPPHALQQPVSNGPLTVLYNETTQEVIMADDMMARELGKQAASPSGDAVTVLAEVPTTSTLANPQPLSLPTPNRQGYALVALQDAYRSKLAALQATVNGQLLAKRGALLQQHARLSGRAGEVAAQRAALERQVTALAEEMTGRLRSAESLKQALLGRDQAEVGHELGAIQRLLTDIVAASAAGPVDFLNAYRPLADTCARLVAKPFKAEVEVAADDLPAEAAVYGDLAGAHSALTRLLGVKDGMIAHLLGERDALQVGSGFEAFRAQEELQQVVERYGAEMAALEAQCERYYARLLAMGAAGEAEGPVGHRGSPSAGQREQQQAAGADGRRVSGA